ncbi:MAG: hypothetical protein U0575_07400 [Phycisphaerales bacterium]
MNVWPRGDSAILLDGHNRHAIAEEFGLSYDTTELNFQSRDEATLWIIDNQLGRRNLPDYPRTVLILAREPVLARMAKARQAHGKTAPGRTLPQNSSEAIEVREQLAAAAGVGSDTVRKVKAIKAAAESGKVDAATEAKLNAGERSIHSVYTALRNDDKRDTSKRAAEAARSAGMPGGEHGIVLCDFRELARSLPDGSVDLIFTDPGITHPVSQARTTQATPPPTASTAIRPTSATPDASDAPSGVVGRHKRSGNPTTQTPA